MTFDEYFDAQMGRIDATDDRVEIAAILDEVSSRFAQDRATDDAELRQERAVLREMLTKCADSLTRTTKPARETA